MFVVAGTSNGSTPPFSSARCFAATAAAIAAAFLASSCGYVTSGGSLKFARSFGGDVHCFGSGYGGSAGTSRGGHVAPVPSPGPDAVPRGVLARRRPRLAFARERLVHRALVQIPRERFPSRSFGRTVRALRARGRGGDRLHGRRRRRHRGGPGPAGAFHFFELGFVVRAHVFESFRGFIRDLSSRLAARARGLPRTPCPGSSPPPRADPRWTTSPQVGSRRLCEGSACPTAGAAASVSVSVSAAAAAAAAARGRRPRRARRGSDRGPSPSRARLRPRSSLARASSASGGTPRSCRAPGSRGRRARRLPRLPRRRRLPPRRPLGAGSSARSPVASGSARSPVASGSTRSVEGSLLRAAAGGRRGGGAGGLAAAGVGGRPPPASDLAGLRLTATASRSSSSSVYTDSCARIGEGDAFVSERTGRIDGEGDESGDATCEARREDGAHRGREEPALGGVLSFFRLDSERVPRRLALRGDRFYVLRGRHHVLHRRDFGRVAVRDVRERLAHRARHRARGCVVNAISKSLRGSFARSTLSTQFRMRTGYNHCHNQLQQKKPFLALAGRSPHTPLARR